MPSAYVELSQDEEKLLHGSESSDIGSLPDLHRSRPMSVGTSVSRWSSIMHWLAHGFTIMLLLVIFIGQWRSTSSSETSRETYTPAFGYSQRPLHFEIFKTAFWQKTPFKAPATGMTKENMEAWNSITESPVLNLTAEEVSKLGLSADSVQWPKSAGGGYLGFLESAHQLHCLQTLWERIHYDKNPANPLLSDLAFKIAELPDVDEAHLEHCVDVIRQRLMCTADANIVTFQWVKGVSSPYPNFHTGHTCADYGGLLKWAKTREADLEKVGDWEYKFMEGEGVEMTVLP